MSTIPTRTAGRSSADPEAGSGNAAVRWGGLLLLLSLMALGIAWLLGWFRFTTDPRVVEIRQMQEEARQKFIAGGGPSTLAEAAEGMATMQRIREKIESLPESLRPQVERGGQGMFRSAMRARIDGYFALPPEKRQAELDRQIRQEELFRKAAEAGGAVMSALAGGGSRNGQEGGRGPGGGGGADAGQTGAGGQNAGQGAGQGADRQGGGGFGGGPPRNGNEDDRNKWRKEQIIDRTTPEERARYVEYRRVMNERRSQLGLPPSGPR